MTLSTRRALHYFVICYSFPAQQPVTINYHTPQTTLTPITQHIQIVKWKLTRPHKLDTPYTLLKLPLNDLYYAMSIITNSSYFTYMYSSLDRSPSPHDLRNHGTATWVIMCSHVTCALFGITPIPHSTNHVASTTVDTLPFSPPLTTFLFHSLS